MMSSRHEILEQSTPQRSRSPLRTGNDVIFPLLSPVNRRREYRRRCCKSYVDIKDDLSRRNENISKNTEKIFLPLLASRSLPEDVLNAQVQAVRKSLQNRVEFITENMALNPESFEVHSNNEFVGTPRKSLSDEFHFPPEDKSNSRALFQDVFDSARIMTDFQNCTLISKTAFARIFSARNAKSGRTVCLKCADPERHYKSRNLSEILTEVQAFSIIRHPNIVKYMDSWIESGTLVMMEEYCFGGSLFQYMFPKREKVEYFSYHDTGINGHSYELNVAERTLMEPVLYRVFEDILKALDYLHNDLDIVHADVKPSNIMIQFPSVARVSLSADEAFVTESTKQALSSMKRGDPSGIVFKLSDFGRSRLSLPPGDNFDFDVGDPRYLPYLEDNSKIFTKGLDIYALGMTIYQTSGGNMREENLTRFKEGQLEPSDLVLIPRKLRPLIKEMLQPESKDRPPVSYLLECLSKLK